MQKKVDPQSRNVFFLFDFFFIFGYFSSFIQAFFNDFFYSFVYLFMSATFTFDFFFLLDSAHKMFSVYIIVIIYLGTCAHSFNMAYQ